MSKQSREKTAGHAQDYLPPVTSPNGPLGCHFREDYELVRLGHRWQNHRSAGCDNYVAHTYRCADCSARLDVLTSPEKDGERLLTAQITNRYLSKISWQAVDQVAIVCSFDTHTAISRHLLDAVLRRHGVQRRPRPTEEVPAAPTGQCDRDAPLPVVAFERLAEHHQFGEPSESTDLAGTMSRVDCGRCNAQLITVTPQGQERPSMAVIEKSRYGPHQAWQRNGEDLEPTDIITAAAILRGYTATLRLRQHRRGIPLIFHSSILRPGWLTARGDHGAARRGSSIPALTGDLETINESPPVAYHYVAASAARA